MMVCTKSEFAKLIGVSPSRISQYIAAGIIGPEALQGEGRSALVKVEMAKQHIAARRHVGQSLGNGLLTRLDDAAGADDATPLPPNLATGIQRAKLEEIERRNRLASIEELRKMGELVLAADMRAELARAIKEVVATYEGMAPDIANALAARFGLKQRDLLFIIRDAIRAARARAAAAFRTKAESLPETVERVVEMPGGPVAGEDAIEAATGIDDDDDDDSEGR